MNNLVHRRSLLRWTIYAGMLLLFYVLQTTPAIFCFWGIKPMLLLPLAVAAACFEDPLPSGIFGLFCGLFTDAAADYLLGFNALILLVLCTIISLLHTNYLKSKLLNTLLCCLCVLLIQRPLDYFFYYSIWGLDPNRYILLHQFLPTSVLTLLFLIPIYYLVKLPAVKLQRDDNELKLE
jgi:rod shape-determining protein MreD